MISGDTRRLVQYKNQLPKAIYQCLEKLSHFDFGAVPDAKVQLGEYTMSVESPSTEPKEERKLEGHEKFIDVVFLIRGEEIIGIRDLALGGKCIESHPDRDLYFYDAQGMETQLYLTPGSFAVCFPEDLHRPLCAGPRGIQIIRKAVVKVPVEDVK